jgi:hypothetical protein
VRLLILCAVGWLILRGSQKVTRWFRVRDTGLIDALIEANAYTYRPGMEAVDYALRDRTTAKRKLVEDKLAEHRRRLEMPVIHGLERVPARRTGTEDA